VTVYHRGFHGDLNETFFVGDVKPEYKKLVEVTYEALMKAIGIVKPGERYREIGNVIQKHVTQFGYSVVKSYCGHGIHRLFHTAPNVPHYAKVKNLIDFCLLNFRLKKVLIFLTLNFSKKLF
jgi:methionyl aminopeptidase